MSLLLCILVIVSSFQFSLGFRGHYLFHDEIPPGDDVGEPLFLTSYIEEGRIEEGRKASEVNVSDVASYAGFFTVNKRYNSNLFFWYFPAEIEPDKAPVLLWLQGGPGASSLNGLFNENGPFYLDKDLVLHKRKTSWSMVFNLIYIDNPVGTGFSFTENHKGYARDEIQVGKDLYAALYQFFTLFPHLQKKEFFISGESYAGKYVPAVGHTIHTRNRNSSLKINLKGLAMGDGWTDPERMLDYGDYLYQLGLIDSNDRRLFLDGQQKALEYVRKGDYIKAKNVVDTLVSDFNPHGTLYYNLTGLESCYNYVINDDRGKYGDLSKFLQSDELRRALHVGNMTFQNGYYSSKYLENDVMQSVKPWIEELLEEYRILFYNGQLDIICAYPLTLNVLQHLKWSGATQYKSEPRKHWYVDGELAGYSKTVKGMTEVLVRNSGHIVPNDQPEWALDMIIRFVFNKPFN
ncbi:venom serine carboxypeptidase [Halyomorpha halys]|uniref:venom serine carboxypeptidase n=1 Tax=Halyomorpha halys TaxID=286706 RepID=UPI0006D520AB|nr:venom serine carboxypeptidase [Halyomorpha halys]KAE8573737.1 Putative retinoid-inducible serine carboxypeptidase [Halyomorpha halys]